MKTRGFQLGVTFSSGMFRRVFVGIQPVDESPLMAPPGGVGDFKIKINIKVYF